jgi:hypothetical protein
MNEVFLTFDVEGSPYNEDSMDKESLRSLRKVLRLLDKNKLKGLFFITASVANTLKQDRQIMELLAQHEIGYHSCTHSRRPMHFEYTDVEIYDEAIEISLRMETSSVQSSTGKILGEGGILSLREIFPDNKIESYRAPFLCWIPPHLEALRKCGLKFDFSSCLSKGPKYTPVRHNDISFYPSPISIDSRASSIAYVEIHPKKMIPPRFLIRELLNRECTVLMHHPAMLAYHLPHRFSPIVSSSRQNSLHNTYPRQRMRGSLNSTTILLAVTFVCFQLNMLESAGLARVTPHLATAHTQLNPKELDLRAIYETSMWGPSKLFGFRPKFLHSHFEKFLTGARE